MNDLLNKGTLLLICSLLLPVSALAARGEEDLEQRLERLEAMLQNQGLLEMVRQLEQLQTEVQELRGAVEQQANEVESLGKRQRDLYMDIDNRLNDLQLGAPAPAAGGGPAVTTPAIPVAAGADVPVATAVSAAAAPAANAEQERAEYMAAFEILREGRYPQAIDAFSVFIKKYPSGKYANNAQYWLGEAHYASRNFQQALVEFEKLFKDYPWSSKLPDAKLKMGYSLYELGQWEKSREVLTNIMTTYPNSSFALLAEKRIQRLTQEGH
jgi:tol-pal system protein YbgF